MAESVADRLSNSKANTYRRCPKKFEYKYVMGLRPRKKAIPLEVGSWMHELLQTYYDGEDWLVVHKRLAKKFYNLFEEEREMLGDIPTTCLNLMRRYLRHYQNDFDRWRVIDTELDEIITLPNGLRFQVIIDLIVEDLQTGKLWAADHKNRKTFGDRESMQLDPQLTRYFYALEFMGYKPLAGVFYNELCSKPVEMPEPLKRGGLSKRKDMWCDVHTYMKAIKTNGLDPADYRDHLRRLAMLEKDRFFRRQYLPKDPPMIKTMMRELVQTADQIRADEAKDRWPRTYIANSCKWDCEVKDLCLTQLSGGDITPLVKMNFETREQRERREKKERLERKKLRGGK